MTAPTPDVEAMEWAAEYIKELIAVADEESEECYAQPLRDKAGLISALLALAREAAGLRKALRLISVIRPNRKSDEAVGLLYDAMDDAERAIWDAAEAYTWSHAWCEASDIARRALTPAEKETPND